MLAVKKTAKNQTRLIGHYNFRDATEELPNFFSVVPCPSTEISSLICDVYCLHLSRRSFKLTEHPSINNFLLARDIKPLGPSWWNEKSSVKASVYWRRPM